MLSPTNCKLRSLGIIVDDNDKQNLEQWKGQLKTKFDQLINTMTKYERDIARTYVSKRSDDILLNLHLSNDQWQKIQQYIIYNDLVMKILDEICKIK